MAVLAYSIRHGHRPGDVLESFKVTKQSHSTSKTDHLDPISNPISDTQYWHRNRAYKLRGSSHRATERVSVYTKHLLDRALRLYVWVEP
jgi:hypothetical protein